MQHEGRKLSGEIKREVFKGLGSAGAYWAAGAAIAIAWSLYLAKALLNFDFVAFVNGETRSPRDHIDFTLVYLCIAIAVTVIAMPLAIMKSRKVSHLAAHGRETKGAVISKGILGKTGMVPVTITYTVDGKEYKFRRDMPRNQYEAGDVVTILYDPERPRRCEVM